MKALACKLSKAALSFSCLIIITSACLPQEGGNLPVVDQSRVEPPIDSSLLLKFNTGVRAILEDSRGNFWFGSHQEGVCLYDGDSLTYFTVEDGLSNNQVRSIYEDTDGLIWFECGRGLSHYDGKSISTPVVKNYLLPSLWHSEPGDLWFKGDEINGYNTLEKQAGVYRYTGNGLDYHVFPIESKPNEAFAYSVSTPFVSGQNGRLWFGTYSAVVGYDGADFTIIDNQSLGFDETTGFLHVRSLFEDSKGNLWIGNNGIGVLRSEEDGFINFSKQQSLISINSLRTGGYQSPAGSLEHVFAIGEDAKGIMWFGDRDTGAWRYDGETMRNYTVQDGLTTHHIWQIYRDKKGELWFAMGDGSVCKFNGTSFERVF